MYCGSLFIFVVAVQYGYPLGDCSVGIHVITGKVGNPDQKCRIQTFLRIPTSERMRNRSSRMTFVPAKALEP
jgi:hypothetical protein